jgi:hypothetical protein
MPGPPPEDPEHPAGAEKGPGQRAWENLKMLFGLALDLWEKYHAGAVTDLEARASDTRHLLKVLSGDCQKSVPVLQERVGSLHLLRLQERDPDPGEVGRRVSGGSTICPLTLSEGPVGPWLTPSRGQR